MLIAVAGAGSRWAVTTTALALATCWPGGGAILLEADPAGGSLARRCGGEADRGTASLTAAAREPEPFTLAGVEPHLQLHPAGVRYLAAPIDAERARAVLGAPIAVHPCVEGERAGVVVVADCGRADVGSAAGPLLARADALVLVVHAESARAQLADRSLRELVVSCRRAVVVLVGGSNDLGSSTDLDVPCALLPFDAAAAGALLHGEIHDRCGEFARHATVIATSLQETLCAASRPGSGEAESVAGGRRRWWRAVRGSRSHREPIPRVYRIGHDHGGGLHDRNTAPYRAMPCTGFPVAAGSAQPGGIDGALSATPASVVVARSSTRVRTRPSAPLASEPVTRPTRLVLRVFGPLCVLWRPESGLGDGEVEITGALSPRNRELLVLLAAHPQGATRQTMIDALWGERCPRRPVNALHTALTRLRAALGAATEGAVGQILAEDSTRYRLDPAIVEVDFAVFAEAVRRRRAAGTDIDRFHACRRILDISAPGVLAAELDTDWIDPIRQAARRDARTALGDLAHGLVEHDPRATLHLLETALDTDPYNEQIYCDILRLHARLQEHHALDHTVELLTRRLAEIGEEPSNDTLMLARHLRRQPQ